VTSPQKGKNWTIRAYTHSLQPTILNDNVNQFKIGLESDKGYFTLKVTFFAPNSTPPEILEIAKNTVKFFH
jgi:hypothetical protein